MTFEEDCSAPTLSEGACGLSINGKVFSLEDVCRALGADPGAAPVVSLCIGVKAGYTEQYYDITAMQAAINESRECGRPIDVQWIIDPPKKPMKEMSALELEETFLYEYGCDEDLSADLADACLKDPSARTPADKGLLEALHFLSVDKNDTALKQFVDGLLYPNAYPAKPGIDTLISKAKSAMPDHTNPDPAKSGKGRS